MKIIVNALSARQGGGQTYLKNLFEYIPSNVNGLEIQLFAPSNLRVPSHPNVRIVDAGLPSNNPLVRTFWERFVFSRILARERPDVLFCPGGVVATSVPRGCRVVTTFQNMMPFDRDVCRRLPYGFERLRNWLLKGVLLRSMAASDLTIFISDFARRFIEEKICIKNAVTIYHGLGAAFKSQGENLPRHGCLPAGKYILYVSKFDVYKHHCEVVKAYAMLPDQIRAEFPLLFVGEIQSAEYAPVTRLIDKLNLSSQVMIVGAVDYMELPGVYRNAHINIFASSCENCPNILLEAMGAGRPVLASNVQPMPEFGGDAVDYFSPFDPVDLSSKLLKLLVDNQRIERLSNAARLQSTKFDWESTAANTWYAICGA